MKYQTSNGIWIEITLKDALTPDAEYVYNTEVIADLLIILVNKNILTFDEAIMIIGESPKRYKVE